MLDREIIGRAILKEEKKTKERKYLPPVAQHIVAIIVGRLSKLTRLDDFKLSFGVDLPKNVG